MSQARQPAVAGAFYPADPDELSTVVRRYLDEAARAAPQVTPLAAPGAVPGKQPTAMPKAMPKAMIVPHAGYVYSGAVAASAYERLRAEGGDIERVVLLGPAHRVPVEGLAASGASAFLTPLGPVPVDVAAVARIARLPQVQVLDLAHRWEHSLEVQLPFLQQVLGPFSLVPLLAGDASAEEVAEVLEELWGGPETLVLISSDLSHYHDYRAARRLDTATTSAIEALRPQDIGDDQACGAVPLRGLLTVACRRGLSVTTLDLRNSGDTAGSREQVVGYGAYLLC